MAAKPETLAILSHQMESYRAEVARIIHFYPDSADVARTISQSVQGSISDLMHLGSLESDSLIIYQNASHVYTLLFVEMVNLLAAAFRSVGRDSQGGAPLLSISQAHTVLKTLRLITIQLFNGVLTVSPRCHCC